MEKIVFKKIHERQIQYQKSGEPLPHARLILDGHTTRRNHRLWEKAKDLFIDVHILPSHTSHIIQPLDRCAFASLKKFFFFPLFLCFYL